MSGSKISGGGFGGSGSTSGEKCNHHGIEDPDERKALGKKPIGCVRLAAANQSGRIHIVVTDDGRGIDISELLRPPQSTESPEPSCLSINACDLSSGPAFRPRVN
jgi:hypothetical protein